MKKIIEKTNVLKHVLVWSLCLGVFVLSGCKRKDPKKEEPVEKITKVTFTFTETPSSVVGKATTVAGFWEDKDGDGTTYQPSIPTINLKKDKDYTLSLKLEDTSVTPNVSRNEEIVKEKNFHMFFFEWTAGLFASPTGTGNIGAGKRSGIVNYGTSLDSNSLPFGIETTWKTAKIVTTTAGILTVELKHQPNLKTISSDSKTGETDATVTCNINIVD